MTTIINKPPLLEPENIKVSDEGEYVKFQVGNSILTLHYSDALKISQLQKESLVREHD